MRVCFLFFFGGGETEKQGKMRVKQIFLLNILYVSKKSVPLQRILKGGNYLQFLPRILETCAGKVFHP